SQRRCIDLDSNAVFILRQSGTVHSGHTLINSCRVWSHVSVLSICQALSITHWNTVSTPNDLYYDHSFMCCYGTCCMGSIWILARSNRQWPESARYKIRGSNL